MTFNNEKFIQAINANTDHSDTQRSVAREAGVQHHTLYRVLHKKGEPKLSTVLKLCAWMKKPITEFIDNC